MPIILEGRASGRSVGLYVSLVFAVLGLCAETPRAQRAAPQTGPPPEVWGLQHGRPFLDDLRRLPVGLPTQREHRPDRGEEREEPPLGGTVGSVDRAAQITAPAAPAPPPGSGNGAGSFAGLDFANFGDGWPPDTNGDVGPTYYIQTVNTSIGIFRKSDGLLITSFSFDTLMSQGNFGNVCDTQNFGDPTVVWDPGADRWVISDFAFALNAGNPVAPYFQCFAVSRTGDPVSGGWNFYALQTSDLFPDYPKLGVWPDALYLTANMFSGNTFKNVRVWALNKAQMYAGTGASAVTFNLPAKVQGVSVFTGIPSTYHTVTGTPPAGRPNFISVIWSSKVARIWKFHVDWNNTANSTLTGPSNVTLATWGVAATSLPAKNGNALDSLRERLMVQSQYTNRGGAESVWLAHTVANPGNPALTSPRWYQLNVTGGTVVISGPLQQSTWAPDATVARWMPSLAVDKDGNMAIGYSASSSTLFPAIRYAGRLLTDPVNTLGQSETSLIEGTASQCCNFSDGSVNNRWGDYSAMTIDPDGCTFWYTTEYYQSPQPTTLAGDNWQTRIGSFKFPSCTPNSATLQGTVTSAATSGAIGGATVTIGASSTTTDASGQYTIASVAPGTYNVTASATGYTSATVSVTVMAGITTTQDFALVASTGTSTSLAVATASGTYGGTAILSATLTASGTGVSGKSISFTLNGSPVGSASTDGSGIATLSNASLSGIGAGTYASGVGASFGGDGSYASSSGTNSLTVAQASQTITFGALAAKIFGDPNFTVSATASSGLVVSFSASGNCTIATTTVTITGAGSCTITASQPGNTNYAAATNVPQTFTIAKASQTITFNALADKTTSDPPFTVSATASSTLPVGFGATGQCTVSGSTVTITAAGSCTITASQAGDANYNPAPNVPRTFNITAGGGGDTTPPTVSITQPTAGNTVSGSVTITATSGDNVGVVGLRFRVDGVDIGSEVLNPPSPSSMSWDSTSVANGSRVLTAVARDAAGHTTSASVTVTVANPVQTLLTTQTPGNATVNTGQAWELGVRVVSDVTGQITRLRFYKGPNENGPHVGHVWNAAGQLLATATFSSETASGWQEQALATPVPMAANNEYVVSVTTGPNGDFAFTQNGFVNGLVQGHLQAPANAAAYGAPNAFPTSTAQHNYFRDLVFVAGSGAPDTTPPTVSFTQPAPGDTVSGLMPVIASAQDDVAVAGVQFQLDGQDLGVEGTVAPYQVTWDTTTASNGAHTLAAIARDAAGHQTTASVSVTVANSGAASQTLLTTQTPGNANVNTGQAWELGVRVRSDVAGQIRRLRFYKGPNENGPHVGHVWSGAGQLLATVTFNSETGSGWQEQPLGTPVAIAANTDYVVSVTTGPNGNFALTPDAFANGLMQGHLQAPANAAVYGVPNAFPTSTAPHNYFRDLVFVPQ